MAAKTIRELTADTAPAGTRLLVTQAPSGSTESTKSTIAQMLAASGIDMAASAGILSERPAASSANGWPWRMIVNQNNFDDGSGIGGENYYNEVVAIGWNLSSTVGVPATENEPAFWDSWEAKYNAGLTDYAFERHFEMVDSNGDPHRVFSFLLPHDGGTGSAALFAMDKIDFFAFDAGDPLLQIDLKNNAAYVGDGTNTFTVNFPKNNAPIITQRNAADSANLYLPYFDANDQLVVAGQLVAAAAAPGIGAAGHAFTFTGAAGNGSTLFAVQLAAEQASTGVHAFSAIGSVSWDFDLLIQNNNAGSSSAAVMTLQTAAPAGSAYLRVGYTAGAQWSMGLNGSQNFALHGASYLAGGSPVFSVDKTNLNVAFDKPPKVPSHAMAALPSASTFGNGSMIYVTDESGGAVLAISDGSVWRRVTDRAEVSS